MTGGETPDDETVGREERLRRAAERRELDPDALERAHEDAQLVLEQTLQLFSSLSDEAFRLVRLNALILTILVAVASQVRIRHYVNVASVAALLLFITSALFALVGYLITAVDRGIHTETFDKLTTYRLRETEYLDWVLTLGYPDWIRDVVEKNRPEGAMGPTVVGGVHRRDDDASRRNPFCSLLTSKTHD